MQQEDVVKFLTWQLAHLENDVQPIPDTSERRIRADTSMVEILKMTQCLLPEPVQAELQKVLALHTEIWRK
jgi:hypothetical protein